MPVLKPWAMIERKIDEFILKPAYYVSVYLDDGGIPYTAVLRHAALRPNNIGSLITGIGCAMHIWYRDDGGIQAVWNRCTANSACHDNVGHVVGYIRSLAGYIDSQGTPSEPSFTVLGPIMATVARNSLALQLEKHDAPK